MNKHLKSLLYLICFVLSVILYDQTTAVEPKVEVVETGTSQEADIIINPYGENLDRTETN